MGTIDLATADELIEFLRDELTRKGDITLELSEVTLVDSRGLRAMVRLAQMLEGRGQLVLHLPPPALRRSLRISGLARLPGIQIAAGD